MRNKFKRGVTVTSLVVYIVLFSSLTLFLSSTYTDLNERLFNSRGKAINYTTFNKLQYNLLNSAKESNSVVIDGPYLAFSNGDKYAFDGDAKHITLNNGVLCTNVENVVVELIPGVGCTKLSLGLKLNKYLNTLEKTVIIVVEE